MGLFNKSTQACSILISNGSRGDFMKVHNGWLYATQHTSIALLTTNAFVNTPGAELPTCEQLTTIGNQLAASCLQGAGGIPAINCSNPNSAGGAIQALCAKLSNPHLSPACATQIRALISGIARVTGATIPAACGITVPPLP